VINHQVKEVDYVRDTTVVDVRYQPDSHITRQSFANRVVGVES
jgi:hypothetical protein